MRQAQETAQNYTQAGGAGIEMGKPNPSVVRKTFESSVDLRPCKCSWVDQKRVYSPLGLKPFHL